MLEVYRSFPSPVFPVSVTIAIPVSISVTVATAVRKFCYLIYMSED